MSLLKKLFGGKSAVVYTNAPFDAEMNPAEPFFAVGDVHGCLALMNDLAQQIAARDAAATVVYVGDYVDRGDDSAQVLRQLFTQRDNPKVVCLTGNHEKMMLDFIDQPATKGARWLRYGGMQTLASFGLRGINPTAKGDVLLDVASQLVDAMGADLLDWLRDLPAMWQSGNMAVVHAGADPAQPMFLQGEDTLAWGHDDFEKKIRQDGIWVLHGHTIVDHAYARDGRIAIDTGAYATGQLTAAYVQTGAIDFLSTSAKT